MESAGQDFTLQERTSTVLILSHGIDGGIAMMSSTLARSLTQNGVNCVVRYIGPSAQSPYVDLDQQCNINSIAIITGRERSLTELWGLLRSIPSVIRAVIKTKPTTIIFAGFIPGMLYPAFLRFFTNAKFMLWEHGAQNTFSHIKKFLFPLSRRLFCTVISVSPSSADAFAYSFGIKRTEIKVIPNGIKTKDWTCLQPANDFSSLAILMPARFDLNQKDPFTLIDAATLLRKKNIPVSVTLVGSGINRDAIEAYIQQSGAASYVKLLPATNDIPSVLKDYNIVCLSTKFEGLGMVLVEGMLAGRFALASRVVGCVDAIVDRETGFLFTAGSSDDCAAKLLEIYALSANDKEIFLKQARNYAEEHFSAIKMEESFRILIQQHEKRLFRNK